LKIIFFQDSFYSIRIINKEEISLYKGALPKAILTAAKQKTLFRNGVVG